MSLEIVMTQAKYGDCILVRCGDNDKKLNILIDSGQTRKQLENVLQDIRKRSESLDFLVLTHDDDDHVKGLCDLIEYIDKKTEKDSSLLDTLLGGLDEERILFNFGGNSTEKLLSAKKVNQLSKNLLDQFDFHDIGFLYSDEPEENDIPYPNMIQIRWWTENEILKSEIIRKPTEEDMRTEMEHLELVILSPTREKLKRYIDKAWEKLNQKEKLLRSENKIKKENEWERSIQYWMDHPMTLGNDDSAANNASISFLLFYKGKCALFAGDASPDDMVNSGREYLSRSGVNSEYLELMLMKMPHHGSSRNVTREFLSFFKTENYLISTIGYRKNQHPGKGMLAEIALLLEEEEKANIYGNYAWWNECSAFCREEKGWEENRTLCRLTNEEGKKSVLKFHQLTGKPIELDREIYIRT